MKKKEQLRTSSVISLHLAESKVRPTESGVVDAPPATASRDDHHADAPEHTLHLPHGHLKRYADRTEAGSFRRIPYRCARTTLYFTAINSTECKVLHQITLLPPHDNGTSHPIFLANSSR